MEEVTIGERSSSRTARFSMRISPAFRRIVVAIQRHGAAWTQPQADASILPGDTLVVLGRSESLKRLGRGRFLMPAPPRQHGGHGRIARADLASSGSRRSWTPAGSGWSRWKNPASELYVTMLKSAGETGLRADICAPATASRGLAGRRGRLNQSDAHDGSVAIAARRQGSRQSAGLRCRVAGQGCRRTPSVAWAVWQGRAHLVAAAGGVIELLDQARSRLPGPRRCRR